MKKTFDKQYYLNHRGCYSEETMEALVNSNTHTTLQEFLNWNISLMDKFYFVRRYIDITVNQLQYLALMCAKVSLEIYEKKYPDDERVADCIIATELFLEGKITREELLLKRNAADVAATDATAYAADAAYAVAYAATAYAATDAAVYAADAYAADAAADAAVAATDAAYAADAADAAADYHKTKLLNTLKQFCTDNE